MRPRIICHMASSLDGRIDGTALRPSLADGDYEATGSALHGDAWICGRTTMQQHFAEDEPFTSRANTPAGPQPVHVARQAKSYAIAVDTRGKLLWKDGDLDGDHLICILSEQVPADYLLMLRDRGISYIVAGQTTVDLPKAVDLLAEHFAIRTLLLEGGGHINGAFLQAGLVDELSLLLVPCVDARQTLPTLFDGLPLSHHHPARFTLKSIDRRPNDTLWLRYEVIR